MKTFLIRRRSLSLLACAAAVCLMFYVINYPAAVDASASQRQLPIYCVQRDQKLASVSFDAAWGNEDTQQLIDILVLSDLPYGTTRCRWDTPINLQELWKQYRRVVKENGAIVLFSAQPFTTELISSNKAMYRYEWIWKKTQPSGFMNAKKMPLRTHENIEIFYRKPPTYNPQMTHGHQRKTATAYGTRESDGSSCYGREERNYTYDSTDRYPVDVLQYSTGDKTKRLHPTQKPVDLLEYLVKTYTNPGETVLDNCMGAGSTGVACMNTGREFVGIELDPEYYQIAKERIEQHEPRK